MPYLNVNVFECFGSQLSLLDLLQSLTHRLLFDLLVFLHDALLFSLFGLLSKTLLLGFAHLLKLCLPLLQLLFLPLDVEALQTLFALLNRLSASEDALMLFAGILQVGCDGLLTLLLMFLLFAKLELMMKLKYDTDQQEI